MNVPEINNITYDKEKGMKKLSREKENELKRQNPEAFLEYYYALRKRFEASLLNKLSPKARKRIHPILLSVIRLRNWINGYRQTMIGDDREKTNKPKIFAVTHICKEDIEIVSGAIKEHYYLLSGDFENLHDTVDGLFLAINGVIYFNQEVKADRHGVKERMIQILKRGGEHHVFSGRDMEFIPQLTGIAFL